MSPILLHSFTMIALMMTCIRFQGCYSESAGPDSATRGAGTTEPASTPSVSPSEVESERSEDADAEIEQCIANLAEWIDNRDVVPTSPHDESNAEFCDMRAIEACQILGRLGPEAIDALPVLREVENGAQRARHVPGRYGDWASSSGPFPEDEWRFATVYAAAGVAAELISDPDAHQVYHQVDLTTRDPWQGRLDHDTASELILAFQTGELTDEDAWIFDGLLDAYVAEIAPLPGEDDLDLLGSENSNVDGALPGGPTPYVLPQEFGATLIPRAQQLLDESAATNDAPSSLVLEVFDSETPDIQFDGEAPVSARYLRTERDEFEFDGSKLVTVRWIVELENHSNKVIHHASIDMHFVDAQGDPVGPLSFRIVAKDRTTESPLASDSSQAIEVEVDESMLSPLETIEEPISVLEPVRIDVVEISGARLAYWSRDSRLDGFEFQGEQPITVEDTRSRGMEGKCVVNITNQSNRELRYLWFDVDCLNAEGVVLDKIECNGSLTVGFPNGLLPAHTADITLILGDHIPPETFSFRPRIVAVGDFQHRYWSIEDEP